MRNRENLVILFNTCKLSAKLLKYNDHYNTYILVFFSFSFIVTALQYLREFGISLEYLVFANQILNRSRIVPEAVREFAPTA